MLNSTVLDRTVQIGTVLDKTYLDGTLLYKKINKQQSTEQSSTETIYLHIKISLNICITVFLRHFDSVSVSHSIPVSVNLLVWYFLGVFCPASTVAHARLLGAHCLHSYAEIPRQCEADMSGISASHQEETGVLGAQ